MNERMGKKRREIEMEQEKGKEKRREKKRCFVPLRAKTLWTRPWGGSDHSLWPQLISKKLRGAVVGRWRWRWHALFRRLLHCELKCAVLKCLSHKCQPETTQLELSDQTNHTFSLSSLYVEEVFNLSPRFL